MARGVNKVIIGGNCGQDSETRFMPSDGAVIDLSIDLSLVRIKPVASNSRGLIGTACILQSNG